MSSCCVETELYKGYKIEIINDEDPESPREWDNLSTMVCFHTGYNLGDAPASKDWRRSKHSPCKHDWTEPSDLLEFIEKHKDRLVFKELFLLDHSGLWMSTGKFGCDPSGWDTSRVGIAYVTYKDIRREFKLKSNKQITPEVIARVEKIIDGEVETYSLYLSNQVYGYVISKPCNKCNECGCTPEDEEVDSCWGIYESDTCMADARAHVDSLVGVELN